MPRNSEEWHLAENLYNLLVKNLEQPNQGEFSHMRNDPMLNIQHRSGLEATNNCSNVLLKQSMEANERMDEAARRVEHIVDEKELRSNVNVYRGLIRPRTQSRNHQQECIYQESQGFNNPQGFYSNSNQHG